jgi:hypothetical protein
MPETLIIFRRYLGLTDELAMIRGIIVSLYCWLLSPFLFSSFHGIIASLIMFLFAFITNFVFLVLNGKKNKGSFFISTFIYFWKIIIAVYKNIILVIISIETLIRGNEKTPYMLRFFFVDEKNLVDGTLLVLQPFLFIVRYKNTHFFNGENYLTNKKMWLMVLAASFIANAIWAIFIYKSGLRI